MAGRFTHCIGAEGTGEQESNQLAFNNDTPKRSSLLEAIALPPPHICNRKSLVSAIAIVLDAKG